MASAGECQASTRILRPSGLLPQVCPKYQNTQSSTHKLAEKECGVLLDRGQGGVIPSLTGSSNFGTSPSLADFTQEFEVETDVSDKGIGAVLMQNKHLMAYLSKALGPQAQGLSTYEKEGLAILMAVEHWRAYLQSGEFVIRTDQRSLVHLGDQRLTTLWQQKVMTKLLGLQYRIVYKIGATNKAADALSRREKGDNGGGYCNLHRHTRLDGGYCKGVSA